MKRLTLEMSQKAIICITTKSNIYYNRITSITLITNFIKRYYNIHYFYLFISEYNYYNLESLHSCSPHKLFFQLLQLQFIQFLPKHIASSSSFLFLEAKQSMGSASGQSFSAIFCSTKLVLFHSSNICFSEFFHRHSSYFCRAISASKLLSRNPVETKVKLRPLQQLVIIFFPLA